MKSDAAVTPASRIQQALLQRPATVRVFHQLGLDACRGGGRTLADASAAHWAEFEMVLAALRARIAADGNPA